MLLLGFDVFNIVLKLRNWSFKKKVKILFWFVIVFKLEENW